jgi:enamine deaminase RidA (YjgF/YER057c/UK114 family)
MTADLKLDLLKNELPEAPLPMGVYKPCLIIGNLIYVSGHGPNLPDGTQMTGKVGSERDIEF